MFDLSKEVGIRNTFLATLLILLMKGQTNLLPIVEPKIRPCKTCYNIIRELNKKIANALSCGLTLPQSDHIKPDIVLIDPDFIFNRRLLVLSAEFKYKHYTNAVPGCIVEAKTPNVLVGCEPLSLTGLRKLFSVAAQLAKYAVYTHGVIPVCLLSAVWTNNTSFSEGTILRVFERIKQLIIAISKVSDSVIRGIGLILVKSQHKISLLSDFITISIYFHSISESNMISLCDVNAVLNKLLRSLGEICEDKGIELRKIDYLLLNRQFAKCKKCAFLTDLSLRPVYHWGFFTGMSHA